MLQPRPLPPLGRDARLAGAAVAALLVLAVVDAVSGVVLISTLGVVVVVLGFVAAPRTVLVVGGVALALGALLASTVDRDDVAPLRVGNIVLGTVIAYVGSAARVRREARYAAERAAGEAEALRLRVVEEEHRRLFDELQTALAPALPELPGWEAGAAYLPAGAESPSGGDLHDLVLLDDGSSVLLVVDVMGHGVRSTRDALEVVHACRAALLTGTPLERLFAQVDQVLAASPRAGAAATVGLEDLGVVASAVAVQLGGDRLRVAGAGHPPPLLVHPDGRTRWLESPGRPIGFPEAGTDEVVEVDVAPGDRLVLCTDGLLDVDRDTDAGLVVLAHHAADSRTHPSPGGPGTSSTGSSASARAATTSSSSRSPAAEVPRRPPPAADPPAARRPGRHAVRLPRRPPRMTYAGRPPPRA